ncbi:CGNR zinc finger domain-containing protein [Actinophytocola sp.]|uniref:CGNR zinc finger domain-containing protein n=1 Tax=Actinophytocola sp. TaxID=1872138 RepID=UPI002ED781FA
MADPAVAGDVAGRGHPFGDLTRGGRQRYCSPTCANRDAVRRHRAKLTRTG